jgi:hypothetical protein
MDEDKNIFNYIITQEANYKQAIPINDSWNWSMRDHIRTTELYTNSQLLTGKNDFKPVKNITRPILNLQHRTEDLELKDVQIYVDNPEKYHLSFLVKKYHDDVFVYENDLDTYFDELNVSRIDFGAGLSKKLNKPAPEVVALQSIAFCDQTDILSGPIGIRHYYSPDQLMAMSKAGWGNEKNGATISLKDLVALSRSEKKNDNTDNQFAKTTGRYIEVFEVHGNLPKRFADPMDESGEYESQLFIVAFYQNDKGLEKQGVILYTKPEPKSPFKLIKRDPVYGRALGFGGAEELFEAQVWVNYDMIRMQAMLDAASVTILKAVGPHSGKYAGQKMSDLENLEILDLGDGGDLGQVDTFPRNMQLFDQSVERWEAHAQQMGAANDSIMGNNPTSGTPFKLQELVTSEAHGLHEYRRQQFAKHIEEIYKDWIIPHIQKKICEGSKFLTELSLEELQYVAERVAINKANQTIKEMVLAGEEVNPDQIQLMVEVAKKEFTKDGNKRFIEILKNEFKDAPLSVKVSVSGKSKDLSARTDKLVNIFRQIIVNPQVLTLPPIAKIFNDILESSGLDPADFSQITQENLQAIQPPAGAPVAEEPAPING